MELVKIKPSGKSAVVHFYETQSGILCGKSSYKVIWTTYQDEVTCKACLAKLKSLTPKRTAVTAVMKGTKWGLGLVEEFEPGYTPMRVRTGLFNTFEEAMKEADKINFQRFGLDRRQTYDIVATTMRKKKGRR